MCKLKKSFGQFKEGTGKSILESELIIEVDYDAKENAVTDEPVKVWAHNSEKNIDTDLTAVFNELLSEQLEEMISQTDWREIYRENKVKEAA